jgi:hypothetical protein
MGEISKLGWMIGLVKHAKWADSLYFPYLLLISISRIIPAYSMTLFIGILG